jgi:hypothetical protein
MVAQVVYVSGSNPGNVGLPAYDDIHPYPHVVETASPDARYAIVERQEGALDLHACFNTVRSSRNGCTGFGSLAPGMVLRAIYRATVVDSGMSGPIPPILFSPKFEQAPAERVAAANESKGRSGARRRSAQGPLPP